MLFLIYGNCCVVWLSSSKRAEENKMQHPKDIKEEVSPDTEMKTQMFLYDYLPRCGLGNTVVEGDWTTQHRFPEKFEDATYYTFLQHFPTDNCILKNTFDADHDSSYGTITVCHAIFSCTQIWMLSSRPFDFEHIIINTSSADQFLPARV